MAISAWKIAIDGVGPRENGDAQRSVNAMVQEFVSALRKRGYIVTGATFTHTLDMTGVAKHDSDVPL